MLLSLRVVTDHADTAWCLSCCYHLFFSRPYQERALWKRGVSPSLKYAGKKLKHVVSTPVWADLSWNAAEKHSLAFGHLISLKTNVFWGDEDWFSKTGCWTGFLPRLAKGWVSAIAGMKERKGARGWEGGQSCSFFQQQGLWCWRDCQPASMAGCNHRQRSWLWSPDPKNSPRTISHRSPLPGRQAQVRGKSSLHAFFPDFSKFPAKSLEINK